MTVTRVHEAKETRDLKSNERGLRIIGVFRCRHLIGHKPRAVAHL